MKDRVESVRTAAFIAYSGFALLWFVLLVLYPLPQWAGLRLLGLFAWLSPAFALLFIALPGRQIKPFLLVYAFVAYVGLNALLIDPETYLRYAWPSFFVLASVVPIFANAPDLGRKLDWYVVILAVTAIVFATGIAPGLESVSGRTVFRLNHALFGNGSNANQISAAMLVVAVALLCARREAPRRVHLLAAAGALACGWLIGLCYSYGQFIGAGLAVVAVMAMRRDRNAVVTSIALLIGIALGMWVAWQLSAPDAVKADTSGVRLGIWKVFIERALERPIFGHGFLTDFQGLQSVAWEGHMVARRFAHNGLVHLFAQGGVVGLALFAAAASVIGWRIVLHARAGNPLPLALAAASGPFFLFVTGPLLYWPPAFVLTTAGVFAAAAVPTRT